MVVVLAGVAFSGVVLVVVVVTAVALAAVVLVVLKGVTSVAIAAFAAAAAIAPVKLGSLWSRLHQSQVGERANGETDKGKGVQVDYSGSNSAGGLNVKFTAARLVHYRSNTICGAQSILSHIHGHCGRREMVEATPSAQTAALDVHAHISLQKRTHSTHCRAFGYFHAHGVSTGYQH